MGDKILAPFQYSGTMNSTLFEHWFTQQLLLSLEKGTVIVPLSIPNSGSFLLLKMLAVNFSFCLHILQISTPLKNSGLG